LLGTELTLTTSKEILPNLFLPTRYEDRSERGGKKIGEERGQEEGEREREGEVNNV
jgi:hypothetical protein